MGRSVNRVVLLGSLERDPEFLHDEGIGRVARLIVSTSDALASLNRQNDLSQCHQIVIQGESFISLVERDLRKGTRVYLEGMLQSEVWANSLGREFSTSEVVVSSADGKLITFIEELGQTNNFDVEERD
jgi:single-strand DNA-binding protein